jgi:cupin 2 domain-containing protein
LYNRPARQFSRAKQVIDKYFPADDNSSMTNLFADIPEQLPAEFFETILENTGFKLERIVSKGHATAAGQWYDQAKDEWVLLLKGSAGLRIEGRADLVVLKPGDHLHLPAHCRHRVEWTEPGSETIWLALHYLPAPMREA